MKLRWEAVVVPAEQIARFGEAASRAFIRSVADSDPALAQDPARDLHTFAAFAGSRKELNGAVVRGARLPRDLREEVRTQTAQIGSTLPIHCFDDAACPAEGIASGQILRGNRRQNLSRH